MTDDLMTGIVQLLQRVGEQLRHFVGDALHPGTAVAYALWSLEERGDTAVADVCQEFSRLQRLGDDRSHRIDTSVLQRETWVYLADGWKRLNVTNEHGMRWFVDGVRVDPSKPYTPGMAAYVPDPDPPTGCGLR